MEDREFAEAFTAGMNSRGAYLASGLLKAIDLKKYENILDIGGASGIYSAFMLKNNPRLHATIFEKPPVDKISRYSLANLGLEDRANVFTGDMFRDSFPNGYDLHFISHVLHDWDLPQIKLILKNSYDNLSQGGTIIIHDAHINRTKTGPISIAEYSVLLMFLSEGKCYSISEMQDILEATGFRNIEYISTILNRSVIVARK